MSEDPPQDEESENLPNPFAGLSGDIKERIEEEKNLQLMTSSRLH